MGQESEIIKSAQDNMQMSIPATEVIGLYASASMLKLTEAENKALLEFFQDDDFEIRPDGHIYIPQTLYRNRLNRSLGIGQWGLIIKAHTHEETGTPDKKKIKMLLNGILVIRGCFLAEAVGEAELHLSNENQSLGTVWEAAKSDCITRCCKDASIGQQSSSPSYVREWQSKYAIQVWVQGKQKPQWRKISAPPFFNELEPVKAGKEFPFQHPTEQRNWLNKTHRGTGGLTGDWLAVTREITEKKITSVAQLEQKFKINADIKAELEALIKSGGAAPAAEKKPEEKQPETKQPEQIPGSVYGEIDKCRTKEDLDKVAIKWQLKIQANQNWREVFGKAKAKLPAAKKD